MEKVWNSHKQFPQKLRDILRISLAVWIAGMMCLPTQAHAQQTPLTIEVKNATFDEVIAQIEKQTTYLFFYKSEEIDNTRRVNIQVRNRPVTDILNELLKNTNLTYRITGKHITILKKGASGGAKKKISGTVSGSDGLPLIGANVVVKGSATGTVTDLDGKFSLEASTDDILSFSYIGYTEKQMPVGDRTLLRVTLAEDSKALEEVVVVGYGTMLKRNLSTSVGTVDADELLERPAATNVFQGLAGKVAGVNIALNSGAPGGSPVIKIRGIGSLNSSNTPLYVVDGVVGVDPDQIDPNIIQSIDILKDATSSAIYGARGANGVVVITTRGGGKQATNIAYNTVLSLGSLARKVDVLDASESLEVFNRAYAYAPGRIPPHKDPANPFARKSDLFHPDGTPIYNTDWQDAVTRTAFSHQHSLSFSAGGDKVTAIANVSYKDNQGIMLETYKRQLNAFMNVSWELKEWFHLQAMLNVGSGNTRNSENNISRYALEGLPFLPVRYADGSYSRKGDYPGAEDCENPVKILKERKNIDKSQYMLANVIGTFQITPWLKLTTSFSRQDGANVNAIYNPSTLFGYGDTQNGRAEKNHKNYMSWTNEDYLTFDQTWNKHNLNVVAGASWYYAQTERTEAGAENFFDDSFEYHNMGVGTVRSKVTSDYTDNKMNSYYARVNYNFDDRYLIGASFREDGSSRFGLNNQYGFFPSFSAAWRLSNERFFEPVKPVVDDMKIRLSYGTVGNAEIGDYATMGQYQNSLLPFNKETTTVVTLKNMRNPDLRWEKSKQLNVGLDLSFYAGRIELLADYYRKITTDLLYSLQLPATTGYETTLTNLGKIRNQGLELSLNTRNIQTRDFLWTTHWNYTMNRSMVIDINGNIIDKWGGRIQEGKPLNQLFGYVRLGTWGSDEAAEAATYHKKPGDIKYWDKNRNGLKDGDDREFLGSAAPKFEMNMTNSFSYKGFTFMFDLQWVYGNKLINFTRQLMGNRVTFSNAYADILQNAWTGEHQGGMVPSLRLPGDGYENDVDSWSCEPGSYLRVRNIGLKYDFSPRMLAGAHIKSLSVGLNVENAFLFTNYSGSDPEVTSFDAVFEQGIDFYTYPKPRTYSFTLGVNF